LYYPRTHVGTCHYINRAIGAKFTTSPMPTMSDEEEEYEVEEYEVGELHYWVPSSNVRFMFHHTIESITQARVDVEKARGRKKKLIWVCTLTYIATWCIL
jgi:hypothetical protein